MKINKILILLVLLSACINDSNISSEKRYKFYFTGSNHGFLFGDKSNKLIKRFKLDKAYSTFIKYYHCESSNNIYMTSVDNKKRGTVVYGNLAGLLENNDFVATLASNKIDLPVILGEDLIQIVIDKNERTFMFHINRTDKLLNIRKIDKETPKLILSMPIYSHGFENLHFFPNTNEVLFMYDDSNYNGGFLINLDSYTYTKHAPNLRRYCASNTFGNLQEKYFLSISNDQETLINFNREKLGFIKDEGPYDLYFNSCSISVGYDNTDKEFEYIAVGNKGNGIGILDVTNYTLIGNRIITDTNVILNRTGSSPLFFCDLE